MHQDPLWLIVNSRKRRVIANDGITPAFKYKRDAYNYLRLKFPFKNFQLIKIFK